MKRMLMALLAVFMTVAAFAQKAKQDGVDLRLLNYGPMLAGNEIKGYYFFYYLDKAEGGQLNYRIDIYDENFNEANSFEITKSKMYSLRSATYNGEAFLLDFFSSESQNEDLITYDKTGKVIDEYVTPQMSGMEVYLTNAYSSAKGNENPDLTSVNDKGFLKFTVKYDNKLKKTGYKITSYTNDLKEDWHIEPPLSDQHRFESFQTLYTDNNYIVGVVWANDKMMSADISYYMTVIDLSSHKILFHTPTADTKYRLIPTGAFYDSTTNQFVAVGEYYDVNDKGGKKRSEGIGMFSFDTKGVAKSKKFLGWTTDVNKQIPVNSKGKLEDGGYLSFERVFKTSDGKIFAIAEQFKKEANAAGVAMAVLTGGRSAGAVSVVDIKVMDLMVFEFNPDFSLAKVSTFEKQDHAVSLPSTLAYYPLQVCAMMMKYYGLFDYNFYKFSPDGKSFSVCYDITTRKKDEGAKIGNIVYTPEGKLVNSTIDLPNKPTFFTALPAKWGYIGVTQYFKKEKKIDRRLEKLDY